MCLEIPPFASLELAIDGAVATVVLNRPANANALDATVWREIRQCFEWLDMTAEARAIVLSGNSRNFCSGIDFVMLADIRKQVSSTEGSHGREMLRRIIADLQDCLNALERCRKPVLAAIHGACIGAGLDLIACCDLRYATADARFAAREIDLGIVADVGILQRLPRLIGEGRAREMALTGRDVGGEEAERMGLVNRVYETMDQLLVGVRAVAQAIAAKSPLAVRGVKEVMNYSRDHSVADGLSYVAAYNAATLLSADLDEAFQALREGRKPSFGDR